MGLVATFGGERDSNPRYGDRTLDFESSPFDHSGTSPLEVQHCSGVATHTTVNPW